jgi:hypothetical protein
MHQALHKAFTPCQNGIVLMVDPVIKGEINSREIEVFHHATGFFDD